MAEENLSIKVTGDASGFTSAIAKAIEQFKQGMKGLEAESAQAKKALQDAFSTLDIRSFKDIEAEAVKVKQAFDTIYNSAGATGEEVTRAAQAMKEKLSQLDAEMRGSSSSANSMGSAFNSVRNTLLGMVTAFVGFEAIKGAFSSIVQEGSEAEQQLLKLSSALGGGNDATTLAKDKLAELGNEANRLGQDTDSLTNNYIKLTLAAKGTASAGATVETAFAALNNIQGALGLTTTQTEGIMALLAKAFSKGSVSAKDLRAVLLEAGLSMEAFASASGKSLDELNSDLKEGTLSASELARGLQRIADVDLAGQSTNFANTFDGQLQILKNQIADVFNAIADSGAMDSVKESIQAVINKIKEMAADGSLQDYAKKAADAITALITIVGQITKFVLDWKNEIAALVAVGIGAWTVQTIASIVALTKVTEASALSARALALAIKAIPVVAAGAVGYEIGTWLYDAFTKGAEAAKGTSTELEKLKTKLQEIKPINAATLFKDIDAQLATTLQNINKEYADANKKAVEADKQSATDYSKTMAQRVATSAEAAKQLREAERELVDNQRALEREKSDLTKQHTAENLKAQQQAIQRELAANETKNSTLLAAEQRLHDSQKALSSVGSSGLKKEALQAAQESARVRVEADKQAVEGIKKNLADITQADKVANDIRVANQKKASDAIDSRIAEGKAQLEAIKQSKVKIDQDYLTASAAIHKQRADEIANLNIVILENAKSHGRAIVEAEKQANEQRIGAIRDHANKQRTQSQEAVEDVIRNLATVYNAKVADGKKLFETEAGFIARKKQAEQQLYSETLTMLQVANDKKKQVTADELKNVQLQLNRQLELVKSHYAKIQQIEEQQANIKRSTEEKVWELQTRNLDVRGKADAIETRINENLRKSAELRVKAANETGEAQEKTLKQQDELLSKTQSLAQELANLGNNQENSVLSVETATNKAITAIKQVEAEQLAMSEATKQSTQAQIDGMEKSGGAIDKNKSLIASLTKELENLKNTKIDVKINLDDNDIAQSIEAIRTNAASGVALQVKPDTAAAQSAIAQLQLPTSSTHTVYVRKVETFATGGHVQKFASGGFVQGLVTGAGTDTSDSIPAMLSNNEFVIRAAAVRKFGVNFLNSLNAGVVPNYIPRFATGGLVGGGSSSRSDTVNLNVTLGGNSYKLQGHREQALGLATALQALSRGA